jgi:hypothetical protein
MKFDWYQATISENPFVVLDSISKLGHSVRKNDKVGKMYRYTEGYEVHHNQRGVVAFLACGGNGEGAHAWATSDDAPAFADLLRNEWPDDHLVTRLDTAEDFIQAGAYNNIRKKAKKIASNHRLTFQQIVDEVNPEAGRTQYMGSPKSDYRARLYEKGFQLLTVANLGIVSKDGIQMHMGGLKTVFNEATGEYVNPSDWVRLELQVRPSEREARKQASIATPEQAWSFTAWSHDLAREAMDLELGRFYTRTRKISVDEQALRWMCHQYSGMILRLKEDLGDWPCVGLEIGGIIQSQLDEKDLNSAKMATAPKRY